MPSHYDALLVLSFGGPEKPEEVLPFLENVLRGKNVPRERMLAVAEHYYHFGGISPINQQNRNLIAALQSHLEHQQMPLPIYWGNRNWHPMLTETLRQMAADGVGRALAIVTRALRSYSGCRQYREDIARAQSAGGPTAPEGDKLRVQPEHVQYLERQIDRINGDLQPLKSFVLPGGSEAAAWLHLGRTVCRRAEREVWRLAAEEPVGGPVAEYLNRLSDLLFVMARAANDGGATDVLLQPVQGYQTHRDESN